MVVTGVTGFSSTKTDRAYYTPERLQWAQDNIQNYQWAQSRKSSIIAEADKWLKYSDEELRMLVAPPQLARAAYVNEGGCPEHGIEVRKYGTYPWKISLDRPFKVECPVGGEVYPDNDFEAYYKSCFVNGVYDPEAGDKSLLTGDIVDDGWGYDKPNDDDFHKYWFIAYYVHWAMIQKAVIPILQNCPEAYLLTGDERYAHVAAVVMWQLAQYYPDYNYETQSRNGIENNHSYYGRFMYHTWEANSTCPAVAQGYDAIFPYIEKDAALQKMTGQSAAEIKEHIEGRMLRVMAKDIMTPPARIQGNYGMHQKALLLIALACGDEVNSPKRSEMINWVMNNDNVLIYTDMSVRDALYNVIYRDGVPFESPGYNWGWVSTMLSMGSILDEVGEDVLSLPRYKGIFDWAMNMRIAGNFTPALGDSGNMYHGVIGKSREIYGPAFSKYGDAKYAQMYLNAPEYNQLFAPDVSSEIADMNIDTSEPIGVESHLFPGYGMAILQTGNDANRTALMFYTGANRWAHAHYDAMHIDLYSRGLPQMPDFGYPETANSTDPRRYGLISHTVAHNLVMVNEKRSAQAAGRITTYDAGPFAQVVDAHCEDLYPGTVSMYRRTLGLVDASPSDAYVVDIVRVKGGTQHDWLAHGHEGTFESDIALSEPRTKGTLAGPDVDYGYFYDNEVMAKAPYGGTSYTSYAGSGFMYLFNVQEGALDGASTVSFLPTRRPPGTPEGKIVNRVHMVGDAEEVFVCDGKPQQSVKVHPETVKFVVRRRVGEDLESTFISVYEPYLDNAYIASVERLAVTPDDPDVVALRINRVDGGTDYFVSTVDDSIEYSIEGGITFKGETGTLSITGDGRVQRAKLTNGSLLGFGEMTLTAKPVQHIEIADVDYQTGAITLATPLPDGADLVGTWVSIDNERHTTMYCIEKMIDERTISIGDQDTRCGRLLPTAWDGATHTLSTSNYSEAALPGMYLADEDYAIIGPLAASNRKSVTLEPGYGVELEKLPDADGDGAGRLWILDFAAGDMMKVGNSVYYEAKQ